MSRIMPVACVVVGLGLALGFGGLAVDSFLEYRAFPKVPTPVTVAQLGALKSVPRGTWVTVVDAKPDCIRGYAQPSHTSYVVVGDGKTPSAVIAALHTALPCDKLTSADIAGVPSLRRTVDGAPGNALPAGLAWPGLDFQKWPEHRAVIVWTWSGPQNSRMGIWLGGLFALLGVWVTWYGLRWLRPRVGDAVVVDPDQFPTTVQLAKGFGTALPATIVWLPVLRAEAVTARGLATDVTIYHLQRPESVYPLATGTQRVITAHTGPGVAGLIFRSGERTAVAAARPAGSEKLVVLRSDLAELELGREVKATLRGHHLRPMLGVGRHHAGDLPYPPRPVHPAHVRSNAEFLEVLARLKDTGEIGLDCEFQGEGRYYPQLCLVQLGFGTESLAIDPHQVNLGLLAPILESAAVRKVLHDCRQDLPLLARAAATTTFANVFDTQVAAAFAGYGGSVGYGALVSDVCGVQLDKSLQVSDWTRELSDEQIEYALDDVRYLSKVSSTLRARLVASGRIDWAVEACGEAVRRALTKRDPEKLYRRVSSIARLNGEELGILREIAKWRERVAETLDRPAPTVASDLALKSMALQPPQDLRALERVRGLGAGRGQPWARELLEAVALGATKPEPAPVVQHDQEALIDGITSVLGLARRFVAVREGIASELLAGQAELRALAEWQIDGRPDESGIEVLEGWRRPVIGELLLEVLSGDVAFRIDPAAPGGTDLVRNHNPIPRA